MPSALSSCPAHAMNAAVGPLSTSPPTIGLTATTGARAAARLAHAGHGEDRADRDDRVRGADHDRARARDRVEHLGRAGAASDALENSTSSTGPAAALADHELLERQPAPARAHARAHRLVAHRQHARADAERVAQLAQGVRQPRARRQPARARGRPPRSRSPRLNQTSTPSSRSPSMTWKVSSRRPQPRSSIRSASQ